MEQFMIKQRVQILKTYYQNYESGAETLRRLLTVFERNEAPNKSIVLRLIKKFETTVSVATGEITLNAMHNKFLLCNKL